MLRNDLLVQRNATRYKIVSMTDYESLRKNNKLNLLDNSYLIKIGEVQKSGASVYYCPENADFVTIHNNTAYHFATANEAYKSQDW